jgi:GT2 family glycosyltransferase
VVPSVVAVVVTHNPGVWFEDALTSVAEQDYRNLSILVVDTDSVDDPTSRIAAIAPGAFVRRLGSNPGYGVSANQALQMVEGAAFYLLCHDDVRLDPTAVRLMVEEAYRSNAGVVGPKIVTWTDPDRLLQVGLGSDQFAVPSAPAERGELDQEQHDAVRDVFSVPGGCLLIRADLYEALGGFDEAMTFQGEDADLCWRAHLAGARVLVAPAARAAHLEALGERRADDRRRLQTRHRLRMVLTNYGPFYTIAILPRQLLLSLVEMLVALVTGRFRHAGDVMAAYTWNLRRVPSLLAKRRRVKRLRQVPDLEIRRLQVRGSARFTAFARGQLNANRPSSANLGDTGRQLVSVVRQGFGQQNAVMVVVIAIVVAFGSRHLLTQRAPVIGEFVPFPSSAVDMLREWWSGWRAVGLGAEASAPTGLGIFGALGIVLLGATGVLRNLLIAGLLPLGAIGAWRLGRMGMPSRAPAVAVLAYLLNPLPYSAFAAGSWRGLAVYAAAPWILRRLVAAMGEAPFAPADPGAGLRGWARPIAALGVVVGLTTIFYPATPLLVLLMVLGLVVGSALVSRWTGVFRLVAIGLGGAATAVALHFPWLIGGLNNHDPDIRFAGRVADTGGYRLVQALHFDVGPVGASRLTWGLFVAAVLPLAIGRGWRLTWAVRAWAVAGACWLMLAAQRAGVIDVKLPPPQILLAPAAAALALAIALGVVAFEVDLPGYRFGWRQLATFLGAAALVLAALPLLASSFDGRWKMPRGGYDRTLRFQTPEIAASGPFRVLWLGHPSVLPVGAWDLPSSVGSGAYATTVGLPTVGNLWAGPETAAAKLLPEALANARAGNSCHLGKLLAPMGVRYLVISSQVAPAPFGGAQVPADPSLRDLLASQLDLEEVDVNPAIRVFRNTAWVPLAVDLGPSSTVDDPLELDPAQLGPSLRASGFNRFSGDVPASSAVHLSEAASPQWELSVDGRNAPESVGFGWANRFAVDRSGKASVHYAVPGRRIGLSLAQIGVWLLALLVALRTPGLRSPHRAGAGRTGRRARRRALELTEAAPVLVTGPITVDEPAELAMGGVAEPAHAHRRLRRRRGAEAVPPPEPAVGPEALPLADSSDVGSTWEVEAGVGSEIMEPGAFDRPTPADSQVEDGSAVVEEHRVEAESLVDGDSMVDGDEAEASTDANPPVEAEVETEIQAALADVSEPAAKPGHEAVEESAARRPLRSRSVRARSGRGSRGRRAELPEPSADGNGRVVESTERAADEAPEDDDGGVPR